MDPRSFRASLPRDAVEVPEELGRVRRVREAPSKQVRMRLGGETTVQGIPCTDEVVFDLPRLDQDIRASCTLAHDACVEGNPLSGGQEVRWYVGAGTLWMGTLSRPAAVNGVRCEAARFGAAAGPYEAWCRVSGGTRIDGVACDGVARFDADGHLDQCQVSDPPNRGKRWYRAP
jgi:hypothetical protein